MKSPSDAGTSLLEVLVALAVVGIAITGLISGLMTVSQSAALHRDHADVSTYLLAAADTVKASAYDTSCSSNPYQTALATAVPATWTARGGTAPTTTVRYWNPLTDAFDAACPDPSDARAFIRTQLVTVSITAPGGSFSDSISVAKRRTT